MLWKTNKQEQTRTNKNKQEQTRTNKSEDSSRQTIDMVTSFHLVVNKAGGGLWSTEKMKNTSVYEMICVLAPNGVRFVCQ